MTKKTREVAIVGIIAAIYCVVTLALGFISYGPIQFRVSEILMFLPLLSKEYIVAYIRLFLSKCNRSLWSSRHNIWDISNIN